MTVSHPLPPSPLMSESEAAAYLTLQPSTLRAWRYRGGGPRFVTLGRSVRYRVIDLDAWLAGRVVSNTSEAAALEADDQVDTIPRAPRMAPKRPKKSPPPTPVDAPPDVQAAPGEPSPAMVADDPPSPSIAHDAPAVADDQDQVAAEDDQVDDHQLAAAAVALLVSKGVDPDLALEDVDIILEVHALASAEDIAAAVLAMQAERGEEEEESEPPPPAAKKKRTAKKQTRAR